MRQRLRDRETALLGRKLVSEDGPRYLEAGTRPGAERAGDGVEAAAVVLDDLHRPTGGIVDRLSVAGIHDLETQRRRALERGEVVS